MAQQAGGRLVISIDLELVQQPHSQQRQQTLANLTTQLLALLDDLNLPASFAVADPHYSAATDAILAANTTHELAVLADATWAGRGCGRQRFARELARRFGTARAVGLPVSTLALRQVALGEHVDLLSKTGITALRSEEPCVTCDVWQAPPATLLPRRAGWWLESGEGAAKRAMLDALRERETAHWLIDVAPLIDQPASSWRAIRGR